MNTSIFGMSAVCSNRGVFLLPFCVVVSFDGYDTFQFTGRPRQAYQRANRFVRLLEKGYAPKMAYKLASVGISPTLKTFEREFEPSLHTLSDELALFCPEGFEVVENHIEDLSTHEIECLMKSWYMDGEEALWIASEDTNVPFTELRSFVVGMAQREDREGGWVISHHTSNYSY